MNFCHSAPWVRPALLTRTLDRAPCTINAKPSTLNRTLRTLNPEGREFCHAAAGVSLQAPTPHIPNLKLQTPKSTVVIAGWCALIAPNVSIELF